MNNTEFEYETRPIAGYEGLYSVSNTGEVFSHNYLRTGQTKQLKQYKNRGGYLYVFLFQDGKGKVHKVHRLVLEAFVSNPENKSECDHIDTNKENNYVSNLRWSTRKENCNNPLTKEKHIKRKHSEQTRRKMSAAKKGKTLSDETRRKMSSAQKDKIIYTFRNKNTGEVFVGTRYNFYTKYDLHNGAVSALINGKLNHFKGWVLT